VVTSQKLKRKAQGVAKKFDRLMNKCKKRVLEELEELDPKKLNGGKTRGGGWMTTITIALIFMSYLPSILELLSKIAPGDAFLNAYNAEINNLMGNGGGKKGESKKNPSASSEKKPRASSSSSSSSEKEPSASSQDAIVEAIAMNPLFGMINEPTQPTTEEINKMANYEKQLAIYSNALTNILLPTTNSAEAEAAVTRWMILCSEVFISLFVGSFASGNSESARAMGVGMDILKNPINTLGMPVVDTLNRCFGLVGVFAANVKYALRKEAGFDINNVGHNTTEFAKTPMGVLTDDDENNLFDNLLDILSLVADKLNAMLDNAIGDRNWTRFLMVSIGSYLVLHSVIHVYLGKQRNSNNTESSRINLAKAELVRNEMAIVRAERDRYWEGVTARNRDEQMATVMARVMNQYMHTQRRDPPLLLKAYDAKKKKKKRQSSKKKDSSGGKSKKNKTSKNKSKKNKTRKN